MKLFASFLRSAFVPPHRLPDFVIGPVSDPYMCRWWLLPRNRVLNVYLHCIRHDDDDRALHDHPWPSFSILIDGRLGEHFLGSRGEAYREVVPGRPLFRGARFAHRLVLPDPGKKAWTLFVTGPRLREWGFLCPKGWRHWKEFTASGKPGEIGRGCGEP